MKHKKIFATIVIIACTLMLVIGCNVTSHEDVMKSDSTTIEHSDKVDSKDILKDKSDKTSGKKSVKNANKKSGTSADKSSSNANSDKSNSSTSNPSSNNSSSHSSSSANKPVTSPSRNIGNSTPTGCNHDYQPQYKDTYHEAVYEDQPIYENRPVYEERPVYGTLEYYVCNKCGAQFDNSTDAAYHGLTVDGGTYSLKSEQIQTGTEQVQVGTERVQTGTQHVKVKDAYTSHDLVGYFCTKCGKLK